MSTGPRWALLAFAVRVGALCGTMAVGVGLGLFYVTGGTKNARAKRENWSIITFGKIMPFHAY